MSGRNSPEYCTHTLVAIPYRDTKQNRDKEHDEPEYSSILLHGVSKIG